MCRNVSLFSTISISKISLNACSFNYIRWLQDLIDTTSESYTDTYDPSREVMGIDMYALYHYPASPPSFNNMALFYSGVGASCIYPLLACASRPKWLMGGSELDPKNFAYAKQNVVANNLQQRIRLVSVAPSSRKDDMTPPVLPLNALGIQRADFVMCNPPFYRSREELRTAQAAKNAPPSAVCTGADVEMVCEGGDEGFVLRMVEESSDAMMQHRVRWFSSMLGKWASVEVVVANLKERGVDNWAVRSLMGEKMRTQRWAVAWSYGDLRPRAVSHSNAHLAELLCVTSVYTIATDGNRCRMLLGGIRLAALLHFHQSMLLHLEGVERIRSKKP